MPTIFQLPPLYEEEQETPSSSGNGMPPSQDEFAAALRLREDYRLHRNPFSLLEQEIDTERARLRLREALWISLILHGVILALILLALPRLMQRVSRSAPSIAEMLQQHDFTFLQLPPAPKAETPPNDTSTISDQNRRAALRHPDSKLLQELRDSARRGAPGVNQPPAAPAQQPVAGGQAPPNTQPGKNAEQPTIQARLEPPVTAASHSGGAFSGASPSAAIEEAARASADRRRYGSGGDYGAGLSPQPTKLTNFADVLSDTMGVDFAPYLARVLADIRRNWEVGIPEAARPPLMKQGNVSIDFVIQKDGSIAGLRVIAPSGDVSLDRAAWGGITASNPFPPLPAAFRGQYLALRLHFLYNPDRNTLQ